MPTKTGQEIQANWQRPLQAAICETCDWAYLGETLEDIVCPRCYRSTLTPLPDADLPQPAAPELVLPFTVSETEIEKRLITFARSIPFAPSDLKPAVLRGRLQSVYVPAWLVDSDVTATWQAEVGFDYQVVSHQELFEHGQWHTTELEETKIRWEQRVGQLARRYHNVMAPALEEHALMMQQLGAFSQENAVAYTHDIIMGALVRLSNRDAIDAWPDTHPHFYRLALEECRQAATAEHIRQYKWQVHYNNQHWTLLLLPVYSTCYYDDAGEPRPIYLNGRSGQLTGVKRASMQRARRLTIVLASLAVLGLLLSLILLALNVAGSTLTGLLSLLLGLGAIYPLAKASQFNRRSQHALPFEISN